MWSSSLQAFVVASFPPRKGPARLHVLHGSGARPLLPPSWTPWRGRTATRFSFPPVLAVRGSLPVGLLQMAL